MNKRLALITLLLFATPSIAQEQPPNGASTFPGGWCNVYVERDLYTFQQLLARHVAAGHWIVSAMPKPGTQSEYFLAICSSKPAGQ